MGKMSLLGLESWAYDQTHLGIIITDSNLKVLFLNRWFEEHQVIKISKASGAHLYTIFPGLQDKSARMAIETALNGQPSVLSNKFHKYIIPVPLAASQYPHFDFMEQSVTISPRIVNGQRDGIFIVLEDVTDRVSRERELLHQIAEIKMAHERLHEISNLNRILLETLPFPMAIIDSNGSILFMNHQMNQLSPGNHIGKKCWEVYRPDLTPCPQCPARSEIIPGEVMISETHQIMGGKIYEMSQTGMMYKGEKALLEVYMDITERKKSEEVSKRNAAMFRNLNKESNEIIQLPDLKSIYKYICNSLHQRFPQAVIVYVSVDEALNELQISKVVGLKEQLIRKVEDIIGFSIEGRKFNLVPAISHHFQTDKIHEIKGDLSIYAFGEFTTDMAVRIHKLLNIHRIYSIGVIRKNELLGAIHFLTLEGTEITDTDYIELFVKQAGLLIQNKMMQMTLLASEKKFRTIFEKSPIGIALGNAYRGRFFIVNERFAQIAGRTIEEMQRIDWQSITHPDDIAEDLDCMDKLNAGEINGFTLNKRYIKPDGSIVWINLIVVALQEWENSNENPQYLTMIEDITEQKNAQIQQENYTRELKKYTAEKDKFFSIIAHDLRGPFNGLLGFTDMLYENLDSMSYEEIKSIASNLKGSVKNTYSLLENLLEWFRMHRGMISFNPEQINLRELQVEVFESVVEMAVNKNITLYASVSEEQTIYADRYMLGAVIRNLLTNAIKFTHGGGEVQLVIEPDKDAHVKFIVKDNGIGMKPQMLENLFNIDVKSSRMGTNNEPSTGLGLLLCKEFVEKHGGRIWAESEPDKGSAFCFVI